MPTETESQWRAWIGKIRTSGKTSVALLAFLLSSGFAYFVYENFVDVPDVVYAVLPTYELEDQSFSGLVVENTGRATAHEVRISLGDLRTTIEQASVQSEESWRQEGGGSGEATFVIWLDRMTRGSSVTIYLLTEGAPLLVDVDVRTDEGPGHAAGGQSIAALALPALLGAVLGGLLASGVWWWLYVRLKAQAALSEENSEEISGALRQQVSILESWRDLLADELEEWRTGKRWPPPPAGGGKP